MVRGEKLTIRKTPATKYPGGKARNDPRASQKTTNQKSKNPDKETSSKKKTHEMNHNAKQIKKTSQLRKKTHPSVRAWGELVPQQKGTNQKPRTLEEEANPSARSKEKSRAC